MHVHILGICGTFMGGLALIARSLGHEVTGSDANVYPPMSTQLAEQGVTLMEGYAPEHLEPAPDLVVIGNALSRGNPLVEAILDRNLPYVSGPQWLAEHVLQQRWVIAVAGTHGKTTTASLAAWILEDAGLAPGFLIGGVPDNFGVSARLGETPFFVIEADEYDTAFFDKRSKFIHYRPRTAVLNNLEFDHADIFPDLDAIKLQTHYFVRTIPSSGLIIANGNDDDIDSVLAMGCWSECEYFRREDHNQGGIGQKQSGWSFAPVHDDFSRFDVALDGAPAGTVEWSLAGAHNASNAVAALAAARHAGVPMAAGIDALSRFRGVKRRLELRASPAGVHVYDDFAHHPTEIHSTLGAIRAQCGEDRVIAVLEPRSNSMRMGVHRNGLAGALDIADRVILYRAPELKWDVGSIARQIGDKARVFDSIDNIVRELPGELRAGDRVVIMSNGAFGDIHAKLIDRLGAA